MAGSAAKWERGPDGRVICDDNGRGEPSNQTTHPLLATISLAEWMSMKTEINDLKRMVRRLTLKLERLDGKSSATEDARRLFDFDTAPRTQVEIEEASEDLRRG